MLRRLIYSPYTAVALAMFFWAASTIVVRGVREEVPPIGLSFWRTLLGFLIVLPIMWTPLMRSMPIIRANIKIICLLAFLLICGGNALLFLSLHYTYAINAAVLNSVEPVLIILVAWLLFRDTITARQGAGVIISLAGVITLLSQGSVRTIVELDLNIGDIIVLGAYVSWAFYAVLLRKAPHELPGGVLLLLILGFGSLFLFPFWLVEWAVDRPIEFSLATLWSVLVLAVFTSVISVYLWNRGVKELGPARASLFIHLIPAYTVVLAVLILDEPVGWHQLGGIALILGGIYLTSFARKKPPVDPVSESNSG